MLGLIGTAAGTYLGGPVGGAVGGALGGFLESELNRGNINDYAASQERIAREAVDASRFRPVGVTTRFGSSDFQFDQSGKLTGAGYTLSPEAKAQQDALMGLSGQALGQFGNVFGQTAPMGAAAGGMFGLGAGYLGANPQEQAQKYMQQQQELLAPGRASVLANLRNNLLQTGRSGLAIGGGDGMMATNPEMAAYYNAIAQQDRELAARSMQGGMDMAKFGAGMMDAGGNLLRQQYGVQSAAFDPYKTALGGAQSLEGMGRESLDIGVNIGSQSQLTPSQMKLLAGGMQGAADTRYKAGSPLTGLLSGMGASLGPYGPQLSALMGGGGGGTSGIHDAWS